MSQLIFEKSIPGRRGVTFPAPPPDFFLDALLPQEFQRKEPLLLPEVSEPEIIRHYTKCSTENYGVDTGFYPLGSCTMKYNPKIHEEVARYEGFADIHPLQPAETVQGALEILYQLQEFLKEISGMDAISLQQAAGAQGEFAAMLMIRAYHRARGGAGRRRRTVIIPDSAHGTNPASATLAGFTVRTVHTNSEGIINREDLAHALTSETAAMMLTNPNTLGLFEKEIEAIAAMVHEAGALLYLDGANLNPLLGLVRPGDMGFDLVHFNLHKTFSTPHGGGGPGAGPIGVKSPLAPFLPCPLVEKVEIVSRGRPDGKAALSLPPVYRFEKRRKTAVGRVHSFYGNFGILLRAYTYIRRLGAEGLLRIARNTILNGNYLKRELGDYLLPYGKSPCMHEFVISAKPFRSQGVHAWDIAKRLMDYGFYPPTINFPLIVEEALMIEAPESESKETLDAFAAAMRAIYKEIETDPEKLIQAPHTRLIRRVDEVLAARQLDVCYRPKETA